MGWVPGSQSNITVQNSPNTNTIILENLVVNDDDISIDLSYSSDELVVESIGDDMCGCMAHMGDVELSNTVLAHGYPNAYGARIPIATHLNLEAFEQMLQGYHDIEIIQFLRYGWLSNRMPGAPDPTINMVNHGSVCKHPGFVDSYIEKEIALGATIGPFQTIPFDTRVGVSPLSTRPKKDTDDRRAILDLSYPEGCSVNNWTPKDSYLGLNINLQFPTVDALAECMAFLGSDCLMWKRDAQRCFCQFGLDPGDYHLFGYLWRGLYYSDKVLAMGHRIALYICQRVTSAVKYIHCKLSLFLLNYVDDFLGAKSSKLAHIAYERLGEILRKINLHENSAKAVPPTSEIEFLGVTFNSIKGTMEVLPHCVQELNVILDKWMVMEYYSCKQLEVLIGKLQFVTSCVRPGWIFISQLLNCLRNTLGRGMLPIPQQVKLDILWWRKFLPQYNGVSIAWMRQLTYPDQVVVCDATPHAIGGYLTNLAYFRVRVPTQWARVNIAYLELWGVIFVLRVWGEHLCGKWVTINCDNSCIVDVLTHSRSRDLFLQGGMREVAYLLASSGCELRVKYIRSEDNRVPDWLSRWSNARCWKKFCDFAQDRSLKCERHPNELFKFTHDW